MCVITPADQLLIRDLNLRVPQGTNLLVSGPNGSGKSSLFRVLGGLWPLAAGSVRKPGVDREGGLSHDIFYVPQKPYVMPGSLREQLVYPLPVNGRRLWGTCAALRASLLAKTGPGLGDLLGLVA